MIAGERVVGDSKLVAERATSDGAALIEDVGLIDVNITGKNFVGALAGYNKMGDITDAYVAGGSVGGVTSSPDGGYIGGLVGYSGDWAQSIIGCHAVVNVTGRYQVGGLVGKAAGGMIADCYAAGHVTGEAASIAGLSNWSACVSVPPPLSARAERRGSTLVMLPVVSPVMEQVATSPIRL